MVRLDIGKGRDVFDRQEENMYGGLRVDVVEGKDTLTAVEEGRWQVAPTDEAEEAVAVRSQGTAILEADSRAGQTRGEVRGSRMGEGIHTAEAATSPPLLLPKQRWSAAVGTSPSCGTMKPV